MFYFLAAIGFEKQLAADPTAWPLGYLQSADEELKAVACAALEQLSAASSPATELAEQQFEDSIRCSIARWNSVGLLDLELNNRIAHTAPPKYAAIAECLSEKSHLTEAGQHCGS
jgi:hypothetical protein